MGFVNKVMLMGNTTRDPELRQLPSGTQVCEFTLAINRVYKTAAGEEKQESAFVDCTAFNRTAEVIHEYCEKGKPLFVEGRLHYETWEDKNGNKRNKLSVIVENFQFVGSREATVIPERQRELPMSPGVRKNEGKTPVPARRGAEQFEQGQRPERALKKNGSKLRATEPAAKAVDQMAEEAGNLEDADLPF
jgi:single-strand DNA-binding protein